MAEYKIATYNPFPYAGEVHRDGNYNWFNCNVIEDPAVRSPGNKAPGGYCTIFGQIDSAKRGNSFPSISYGDIQGERGTIWSVIGNDKTSMLSADEAMKAITGPVKNSGDGWNRNSLEDMGFVVEYYGWYPASGTWYQKWSWQMYNTSEQRLALPVKGIAFEFRVPTETGLHAVNSKFKNGKTDFKARGDQTGINQVWGLWWDPFEGKYYVYEMLEWGNYHAPSEDPALKGKDIFFAPYFFARIPQSEKGGVDKKDKCQYPASGLKTPVVCWSNEKRIEHCHFCGFCVQNETEKKVTSDSPHTNQIGKLSPIPFHIDRNTDGARAVFGGMASGTSFPIKRL